MMDRQASRLVPKPKKIRKGARGVPKVKTGCLTCKIRHKKCDQLKPACSQCVDTGRKCDFLSLIRQVVPQTERPGAFQSDTRLTIRRQPCSFVPLRAVDVLHFEYFRDICSKDFSLFFNTAAWERIILQAACTEPSIRYGTLAIAALSRSHYLPNGANDVAFQTESASEYSTKQYIKAIQVLNGSLDNSARGLELALLGSIVFITIDCIEGYDIEGQADRIRMHLQSAKAILRNLEAPATCSISPSDSCSSVAVVNSHAAPLRFTPNLDYLVNAFSYMEMQLSSSLGQLTI